VRDVGTTAKGELAEPRVFSEASERPQDEQSVGASLDEVEKQVESARERQKKFDQADRAKGPIDAQRAKWREDGGDNAREDEER
jgi:hypothetical protein